MSSTHRPYEVVIPHREDLDDLPDTQRRECVRLLSRLRSEPYLGEQMQPLKDHQVHQRGLEDCRVVRVAAPYELEYRIVYRVEELERCVKVVAVGPRRGSAVYRLAMDRLSPKPEPPRWARYSRGRR